ncbi:putative monovalent cation/H+ antiporter subunit E [Corynebacterium glaucum]|uniref:Putative monovalent cation/H+ antiporter subunit E n=1 Tax=Corynebacterium glaucum TaxID=187491 RepID=A0A1Q2HTH2_9CORY|nr:monovalent cation/H+ antiporter subunit E [Corynebacterium glaucum]AQQ14147.1 putative monovalent cation/H+ antiporter subunit E [Corynebacterium glaucum]
MNIGHWIGYTFWIIKEIFVAGWDAIVAAFKPNPGMKPIVIYYPLRLTGEWDIFWFTSSITATPGTLSMGLRHQVGPKGSDILLVQAAFGDDPEDVIASLADMEEHVNPALKDAPIDPAAVQWEPYTDLGPDRPDYAVAPDERND